MGKIEESELMTRDEVKELLKVSGVTLSKFTKTGRLTFYRVGRRILFDRTELLNEIRISKNI